MPAGHEVLRILKESILMLPEGVEEIYIRSDSAAYQHELLKYCDDGENNRFGRIGFAVGCDITDALKRAINTDREIQWNTIYKEIRGKKIATGQQWAEACFVPNKIVTSKKGRECSLVVDYDFCSKYQ